MVDTSLAKMCAEFSKYAYIQDPKELAKRVRRYFPFVLCFDRKGTQAFVAYGNSDTLVVAFRGTEPTKIHDIAADLKTWPRRSNTKQGLVHSGFADALDRIWPELEMYIDNTVESKGIRKVVFTGHSLGGALAVVAAARSQYVGQVYTYGQPRVGNKKYAKNVKSKVYRFVLENDVVPRVPPAIIFKHQGTEYRIFKDKIVDTSKLNIWQRFVLSMKVYGEELKSFKLLRSLVGDHDIFEYSKRLEKNL